MRKLGTIVVALAILAVSGCMSIKGMWRSEVLNERAVSIPMSLQLTEGTPLYTAFNLWENDGELTDRNYHEGNMIPAGTAVIPISATVSELVFDDAQTQRRYTLDFSTSEMMMPIEEYIRLLFTTRSLEERTAEMSDETRKAIARGMVIPGMTREEVLIAFGPPTPARTPNQKNSTWIYDNTPSSSLRVIFRGNKVRDVIDFLLD